MNKNIKQVDEMVEVLSKFRSEFEEKGIIPIPLEDVDWYLRGLKRLRMLERNLLNLTSQAYDDKAA